MKNILLFIIFAVLSISAYAQQGDPSKPIPKRTYPIDSCLWFQIPFDYEIGNTRTFGGGSTSVSVFFSSTSPTGSITRGQGRFLISSDQFPLANWEWSPRQTGKIQIILPDSALGGGSQDLTGESNFTSFPILTTGFILSVGGNELPSPFQVSFQLRSLETDL